MSDIMKKLEKRPFSMTNEAECRHVASLLVGKQNGDEIIYKEEERFPINQLVANIVKYLSNYHLMQPEEEKHLFTSISKVFPFFLNPFGRTKSLGGVASSEFVVRVLEVQRQTQDWISFSRRNRACISNDGL